MVVLDLSAVPGVVTITNGSDKDRKIGISGHSQSFILSSDATVLLWATTSSELIGYLHQADSDISVVLPSVDGQ